jgi:chromate transporter
LAFIALFAFSLPFPLVVLLAALAGVLHTRSQGSQNVEGQAEISVAGLAERPLVLRSAFTLLFWVCVWQAPVAVLWLISGPQSLMAMFTFFSKMALVTFGGAYAVLAYVAQVAVENYGWLRPGEMLDGLALAETTPGPLVLVLSFIGFLVGFREAAGLGPLAGGIIGAVLVAWATFVPSFIWIFAGAPFIERLRGNRAFSGALSAITAAVVGVILNLSIWFGLHVLFREVRQVALWPMLGFDLSWPVWASLDPLAVLLFLLSAFLLFRMKVGITTVLAVCAVAGLGVRLAGLA